MKSKVHPTYKTKYRVANWAAYNQALVRRGDVTVWLSSDAIERILVCFTLRSSSRRLQGLGAADEKTSYRDSFEQIHRNGRRAS